LYVVCFVSVYITKVVNYHNVGKKIM